MLTTVFLVRAGVTDWHQERKIAGHRDLPLSAAGVAQAESAAAALADLHLGDIVASPLLRAVQTAELIARKRGATVNRDPRLIDLRVGKWESQPYDDVAKLPDYQQFLAAPTATKLPGGEDLNQVRDRAAGAVSQALRDTPTGEAVAIVTHGAICRLLVCHYLGCDLASWQRVRITPGSISVLAFRDDRAAPLVHAVGWRRSLSEALPHG